MLLFNLFEKLINELFKSGERFLHRVLNQHTKHPFQAYQAKFISSKTVLARKHHGFCLDGQRQLSQTHSYRNALVVGGTGTGKSSVVLIPSLLRMTGSFVVHDPSGELYTNTQNDLKRRGYQVLILDFSSPKRSIRYNPLQYVRSIADANKVASLLIRNTVGEGKQDPFWNLQATNLLSLLIRLVKLEPEARHHFLEIRQMLQRLSIYPDRFLRKLNDLDDLHLKRECESFLQFDEKVKAGVIATVLGALHLFQDEAINMVTSGQSLRLEILRQHKTALFIQNPLTEQRYYAALTSMFFEQLFGNLMRWLPESNEHDVFCLIDEAGVLHIPSLSDTIANVRKYRIGILLAIQDQEQLTAQYGREATQSIITNCFAKLYFTGQSLKSASQIEALAGRFVRIDEAGNAIVRPLITRDEVRTLPPNKALLLAGSNHPMLLNLKPYFKQRKLLKRTINQSHH